VSGDVWGRSFDTAQRFCEAINHYLKVLKDTVGTALFKMYINLVRFLETEKPTLLKEITKAIASSRNSA